MAGGHGEPRARTVARAELPGGLSRREVDVPRLAARGLTTQQIADRLSISPKTTDHHIQHIYAKIGVSTRAVGGAVGNRERHGRVSVGHGARRIGEWRLPSHGGVPWPLEFPVPPARA